MLGCKQNDSNCQPSPHLNPVALKSVNMFERSALCVAQSPNPSVAWPANSPATAVPHWISRFRLGMAGRFGFIELDVMFCRTGCREQVVLAVLAFVM